MSGVSQTSRKTLSPMLFGSPPSVSGFAHQARPESRVLIPPAEAPAKLAASKGRNRPPTTDGASAASRMILSAAQLSPAS